MKKILLVILSLALVAGLFVFLIGKKYKKEPEKELGISQIEETTDKKEEKSDEKQGFIVPDGGWDIEKLAKAIYETVEIKDEDGVMITFSQPDIPEGLHLSVKFQIFDEKGSTIERYVSDAGYMTDPKNYVFCEGSFEKHMKTESLKGNMAIASISVKNEEGIACVYQISIHYDGNRTVEHALKGDR